MINLLHIYLVTQAAWISGSSALYYNLSMQTIETSEMFRNDSYFGYSMAYRQVNKRLIISAPRADYVGRLYSCDIQTAMCSKITVNIPRAHNISQDYWLGASVKAGSSFVVTCAPLQIQKSQSYGEPVGSGLCFVLPNHSDNVETLPQINVKDRTLENLSLENTIDSFGWAIDVAPDNSVIVGGPAMFTGRVMKYYGNKIKSTPMAQNGQHFNIEYNFGYSVVSGYFFSNTRLIYAVGAPFGFHGVGQVIFVGQDLKFVKALKKGEDEKKVGIMFGAVLCAAQLKGRSDLIVGAPTYADQLGYNIGAVYIYLSRSGSQIYEKKIVGFEYGSQFGSAIISVGDLDGDKKDEIVIAAPYENEGHGAVYLYSGSDLVGDKSPMYIQRFDSGADYAFGLSLTSILDYDDNGCNELAIGAPETNTVTVLSCIASITAQIFAEFPDLQNRKALAAKGQKNIAETYFTFKSCVKVIFPPKPSKIIATLSVKVEISHPNAVLADPSKDAEYNISIIKDTSLYCRDIGVSTPLNGNYDLEIDYKLTAALLDSPLERAEFDKSRVLLSKHSVLYVRDSVWAADCKGNKSCDPQLEAKILTSTGATYVSGSTESETVSVVVSNTGDAAYSSCLTINIIGAPVVKINSNACSQDSSNDIIKCAPLQPLRTDETWNTGEISFETSQLTNKHEQISVHVKLYNKCQKVNDSKEFEKKIDLISDYSRITIKGNTDISVVSLTLSDVKYDGKKFEHIYTITNNGLTNLIVSHYNITLPKYKYIKYSDVTLYQDNSNAYPCTITSDSVSEFDIAQCNFDKLEKRKKISVIVSIEIAPGTLENIIDKENVTIYTNITIVIGSTILEQSIESVVTLLVATVALWIIILAIVIGLMLLIIIALILRELGFLKREKKQKLENLRKSIRRQTIRRSMMAQKPQEEQRIPEEQEEVVHVDVDSQQAKCLISKAD